MTRRAERVVNTRVKYGSACRRAVTLISTLLFISGAVCESITSDGHALEGPQQIISESSTDDANFLQQKKLSHDLLRQQDQKATTLPETQVDSVVPETEATESQGKSKVARAKHYKSPAYVAGWLQNMEKSLEAVDGVDKKDLPSQKQLEALSETTIKKLSKSNDKIEEGLGKLPSKSTKMTNTPAKGSLKLNKAAAAAGITTPKLAATGTGAGAATVKNNLDKVAADMKKKLSDQANKMKQKVTKQANALKTKVVHQTDTLKNKVGKQTAQLKKKVAHHADKMSKVAAKQADSIAHEANKISPKTIPAAKPSTTVWEDIRDWFHDLVMLPTFWIFLTFLLVAITLPKALPEYAHLQGKKIDEQTPIYIAAQLPAVAATDPVLGEKPGAPVVGSPVISAKDSKKASIKEAPLQSVQDYAASSRVPCDRSQCGQTPAYANTEFASLGQFGGISLPDFVLYSITTFGIVLMRYVRETNFHLPVISRGRKAGDNVTILSLDEVLSTNMSFNCNIGSLKKRPDFMQWLEQHLCSDSAAPECSAEKASSLYPLNQIIFHRSGIDTEKFQPECQSEFCDCQARSEQLQLHVAVVGGGTSIKQVACLRYDTNVFDLDTVEAILRMWTHTMSHMMETELRQGIPAQVSIMPQEDIQKIQKWNESTAPYDMVAPACLHDIFASTVSEYSTRPAVEGCGESYTYAELDAKSNYIAKLIQESGMKKGDIIAIFLPRSPAVYISIIGILKAGGAYIAIDPVYPDDRVDYILQDTATRFVLTNTDLSKRLGSEPSFEMVFMDTLEIPLDTPACTSLATADSRAYAIYTSGSTGRPKGVQIHHSAAVNFVLAETVIYKVTPLDRILQGFSTSFDASVEEVWMAFGAGACLVVGTNEIMQSGPDLPDKLTDMNITMFSTVPTLLAATESDLPSVKLLIVGGEACSQEVANRWSRNRKFFNTYGPTEATVVATYKEIMVDEKVTIGTPLANYRCYVVDPETLLPVPQGAVGELLISGQGVAVGGYINRPDLTAEKFIPDPFNGGTMYRSGDLCRYNVRGELDYCGRIDCQVKVRGYRIELSEIESVMCEHPNVQSATVDAREDAHGMKFLAAWVVPVQEPFDAADVSSAISQKLAAYMVPASITVVEDMPTLPSGKVNRKALELPEITMTSCETSIDMDNLDATQRFVVETWAKVVGGENITSLDTDFFEIGGNSLLCSKCISSLRQKFPFISTRDLYNNSTISKLCGFLQEHELFRPPTPRESGEEETKPETTLENTWSCLKWLTVDLVQAQYIIILALFCPVYFISPPFQWVGLQLMSLRIAPSTSPLHLLATTLVLFVGFCMYGFVSLAVAKWIVLGRFKEGEFPIWGAYHLRWWFVNKVASNSSLVYFHGTVVNNWLWRFMGASVGERVYLADVCLGTFEGDLISIGDGSSINSDTKLCCHEMRCGTLRCRRIIIGNNVTIGSRCVIHGGCIIGDDVVIEAFTMIPAGTIVPPGTIWRGSPGQCVAECPRTVDAIPPEAQPGCCAKLLKTTFQLLGFFTVIASCACALLPTILVLKPLFGETDCVSHSLTSALLVLLHGHRAGCFGHLSLFSTMAFAALAYTSFVVVTTTAFSIMKRILFIGLHDQHTFNVDSLSYARRWTCGLMTAVCFNTCGKYLQGTIFMQYYVAILGAKVGKDVEIATSVGLNPEKMVLEDGCFIADSTQIGDAHVSKGVATSRPVRICSKAFIGNGSVVTEGSTVASGTLVALNSLAPASCAPGSTFVGSPPFEIGRVLDEAASAETYEPPCSIKLARVLFEGFGFCLLVGMLSCLFGGTAVVLSLIAENHGMVASALLVPFVFMGFGFLACLLVLACKWIVMGRFTVGKHTLYSFHVWRTELIERLEEGVAEPMLLLGAAGTALTAWWYTLMGATVGKRPFLNHCIITEPDLVKIGDYSSIDQGATIQAHLFQDRVRTMEKVNIGSHCDIGCNSVVLLGSEIGDEVSLGAMSLLMQHESVPSGEWHGSPAELANQNGKGKGLEVLTQ
jgi:non-ribosomal peptide synthetase-like protein